ncbi:hypothetical protein LO80_07855 [Candidatus Francisella endociliophora]|uniref:Uncharacterized protein n=1 Tax=Candidatus Francisella endociliophora TaxID=653937 RepID=A0A097ES10_9GAMM|nr:hypothetical protein LO80_07855 [Francisella sp. FSC1006]
MHKLRGSSLLTALIFAFVLMVIVSAIAYNFRVSSLTIGTLIDEEQNINIDEGYVKNLADSGALATAIDENIDSFRFETIPTSMTPKFYVNNTSATLYAAEPFLFSYDVTHNFFNNGVNEYTKNIIFNTMKNSIYTQYEDDVYPINVPYVNTAAMADNAIYRFSGDSSISQLGYIGYIEKDNGTLNVNASGTSTTIDVPNDLSVTDYKFRVGWDLKSGFWNIFLATYDVNKVYTSSTSLNNIVSNSAQAKTDLENWQEVALTIPSGSTISSGSVILTKWYHDSNSDVPKPLILKKDEQSDTSGTYYLNFYNSTYDPVNGSFSASLSDGVSTTNNFDVNKVFIVVPDRDFNLNASSPLVFQEDGSVTKVFQFNLHSAGTITYLGSLSPTVEAEPVLIKRNATQSYLYYHNGSSYYSHYYSAGSLNTTALTPIQGFWWQTIQKLIPKFGALFIVTEDNIYIDDFSSGTTNMMNRISINDSNYQFLRDVDGLIYAIPDGLTCQMSGNCNEADRLYIRDEGNCSGYTGGCDFIDDLNNIGSYLGMVYKNIQH